MMGLLLFVLRIIGAAMVAWLAMWCISAINMGDKVFFVFHNFYFTSGIALGLATWLIMFSKLGDHMKA